MRRFTKISILTVLLVMPMMAMPQTDSCQNLILNFRFDDARQQIFRMPEGYQTAWLSAYTLFVEQLSELGKPQPDALAELLKTARHHQANSADYQQCLSIPDNQLTEAYKRQLDYVKSLPESLASQARIWRKFTMGLANKSKKIDKTSSNNIPHDANCKIKPIIL